MDCNDITKEVDMVTNEVIMTDESILQDTESTTQTTSRKRSSEEFISVVEAKRERLTPEKDETETVKTVGLDNLQAKQTPEKDKFKTVELAINSMNMVDNLDVEEQTPKKDNCESVETVELAIHSMNNLEEKPTPETVEAVELAIHSMNVVDNLEEVEQPPKSSVEDLQAREAEEFEKIIKMTSYKAAENKSGMESSDSGSSSESEDNSIQMNSSDKASDDDFAKEMEEVIRSVHNELSSQTPSKPSGIIVSTNGQTHQKATHEFGPPTNQSKQPEKIINPSPLCLIAEAMGSFDVTFPKFDQHKMDKPEKTTKAEDIDEEAEQSDDSDEIKGNEEDSKPDSSQKTKSDKSEVRKRKAKLSLTNTEENDDSSSSSSPNECPSKSAGDKLNFTKTDSPDKVTEENVSAKAADPATSGKESDSDDSNWRQKSKTLMTEVISGRDFYEDGSNCEDDRISSREFERILLEHSQPNVLNDYEQVFHELRKMVEKVANQFKYEIYSLLYPIMVMAYLRMIASGKFRRGKAFVESCLRYIDDSYMGRVEKLLALQSAADLPKRAKKLLINENDDQIVVAMCEETYDVLLILLSAWNQNLQLTFLRHFDLVSKTNDGKPSQHLRIGCATLEKIYWATSEAVKESSPRPLRRKRSKKTTKASPTKNLQVPTGNRLYTPMPKRWDQERQKDDEEHRVPLNRENLPSAYVYTAIDQMETVICASFSSNTTMLGIGTTTATVHVFSLTSSKLVQLKPADCLKKLDTSMSGIDESMLDESNKKVTRKLHGHQGPVYGCVFAPHDRFLLSSSQDRTVRCWCLLTWRCVVIYPGHSSAVYCVNYAPSGYYFASGSNDRTARIWTQDNKKTICILVGHLAEVVCCKFHPNRHYLGTGSADCTVRLWDIIKALQVRIFTGHRGTINAIAYSICGRYMVSGADDRYIIVWDIDKEVLVRSLLYHTDFINCIEFPLDNNIFVVGGQDCQMTIWDFERLVQEYDSNDANQSRKSNNKCSILSTEEFLIKAYASKGAPFYKLHTTSRNLLLGFCVESKEIKDESKQPKMSAENIAGYEEWLEFLDILKIKACCAQNKDEIMNLESTLEEESESSSDDDSYVEEHDEQIYEYEEEEESQQYEEEEGRFINDVNALVDEYDQQNYEYEEEDESQQCEATNEEYNEVAFPYEYYQQVVEYDNGDESQQFEGSRDDVIQGEYQYEHEDESQQFECSRYDEMQGEYQYEHEDESQQFEGSRYDEMQEEYPFNESFDVHEGYDDNNTVVYVHEQQEEEYEQNDESQQSESAKEYESLNEDNEIGGEEEEDEKEVEVKDEEEVDVEDEEEVEVEDEEEVQVKDEEQNEDEGESSNVSESVDNDENEGVENQDDKTNKSSNEDENLNDDDDEEDENSADETFESVEEQDDENAADKSFEGKEVQVDENAADESFKEVQDDESAADETFETIEVHDNENAADENVEGTEVQENENAADKTFDGEGVQDDENSANETFESKEVQDNVVHQNGSSQEDGDKEIDDEEEQHDELKQSNSSRDVKLVDHKEEGVMNADDEKLNEEVEQDNATLPSDSCQEQEPVGNDERNENEQDDESLQRNTSQKDEFLNNDDADDNEANSNNNTHQGEYQSSLHNENNATDPQLQTEVDHDVVQFGVVGATFAKFTQIPIARRAGRLPELSCWLAGERGCFMKIGPQTCFGLANNESWPNFCYGSGRLLWAAVRCNYVVQLISTQREAAR
ncbi:hypothetical protein ACLKA6_011642 [Drosophila palustris]